MTRLERLLFVLTVATVAFVLGAMWCHGSEPKPDELPTVRESVDELVILRLTDSEYARVIFWRDGKPLATRLLLEDDMVFTTAGDKFQLCWVDLGRCHRVIDATHFSVWICEIDPTIEGALEWWNQARRMTDLKEP